MLSLLICALSITFCMYSMEHEDSKYLTSLFSHLFPGKEESKPLKQKISLPLEKITITKDQIPLLERSFAPDQDRKRVDFITSSLAAQKNLENITPSMLIFGESGMGKSTLARSIAYQLQKKARHYQTDWTIYRLESTDLANEYQNSGPQTLKAIAEKIFKRKKSTVLIIEDMNGFYLNFNKSDTTGSQENAVALWQFLDKVHENPQKNVCVIATESNTKMPLQLKDRLAPTMIHLKEINWISIANYLDLTLKKQPRVHYLCVHAPCSQEAPLYKEAIKTDTFWLVCECNKDCEEKFQDICIDGLNNVPNLSYHMLDGLMDQTIRLSSEAAFKENEPYTFRTPILLDLIKETLKHKQKSPEHILLKMDQEYQSEQERLHKKQLAQQKRFHEEQQGLSLLQSQYAYRQTMQQLVFSTALDNGGMPGSIEAKPEELLDSAQQQLYENAFVKNVPNKTPLFPDELSSTTNNELMQKTLQRLKKLHHEKSKK